MSDDATTIGEGEPTKNFDEQVDGFEISQFVVVCIYAEAKE